jgi:SSS family solute:Na+ symporter
MQLGGQEYLSSSLPEDHLKLTGGASPLFITVWFLIALWTFADPGFHQRCYSAKDSYVARKGIIISIFCWAVFDFLTTVTGLYARAFIPDITQPVLAYPLFADKLLSSGFKGIFFAAMFATIMSTFNSFLFLSGTTIGRDFIFRISSEKNEIKLKGYVRTGLLISGILSVMIAYFIPSVIKIWYTIGSIFIPGIIIPVITSYYTRFKIKEKFLLAEMILSVASGVIWFFVRELFEKSSAVYQVEPMLAGLFCSLLIHLSALARQKSFSFYAKEKK